MYGETEGGREELFWLLFSLDVYNNTSSYGSSCREILLPRVLDYIFEESNFPIEK